MPTDTPTVPGFPQVPPSSPDVDLAAIQGAVCQTAWFGDVFAGSTESFDEFCALEEPSEPNSGLEQGLIVFQYDTQTGESQNLTPGSLRGFGDGDNRYPWSMTEFNGQLYVGTLNSSPDYALFLLGLLGGGLGGGLGSLLGGGLGGLGGGLGGLLGGGLGGLGGGLGGLLGGGLGGLLGTLGTNGLIDSNGGEIWRYDANNWDQVYGPDDGLTSGQAGFREMTVYDGMLYAATSNQLVPGLVQASNEPATILRTSNGDDWSVIPQGPGANDDPFDNPANSSIRTMAVYTDGEYLPPPAPDNGGEYNVLSTSETSGSSYLIVGTQSFEADGPELWAFSSNANEGAGQWIRLDGDSGDADIEGFAVSEIIEWQSDTPVDENSITPTFLENGSNSIVFGTWNTSGYNLYAQTGLYGDIQDITPQSVWIDANNNQIQETEEVVSRADWEGDSSPFNDLGVMKLFEANGYLYLGTVDYLEGTTLMRTNDPFNTDSWQLLTMDGFKTELNGPPIVPVLSGNFYIWSAAVLEEPVETLSPPEEVTSFDVGPSTQDVIYVGTFGGLNGSGAVLRSEDGVNFSYVTSDAFGENNIYGMRTMDVIGDQLYIGGSSNVFYPSGDMFGISIM